MIANDPNMNMAEQMVVSHHNNPSSYIAYIFAGHNSNFTFQKAISGATMPFLSPAEASAIDKLDPLLVERLFFLALAALRLEGLLFFFWDRSTQEERPEKELVEEELSKEEEPEGEEEDRC
jgi:hypothetical protein